jgi:hypothetical protein
VLTSLGLNQAVVKSIACPGYPKRAGGPFGIVNAKPGTIAEAGFVQISLHVLFSVEAVSFDYALLEQQF